LSAAVSDVDRRHAIDAAAVLTMLGLTLSWGLNGVAAKLSNVGYDPVFLTVVRSLIGGLLVFLWCWFRGIRLFERDGSLWLGLVAGVLFALEFLLIFAGLDHTTVARSALLVNTMPFWVLLGAHFMLGEHMSARKWIGLLLAFAGLVVVFSDKLSLPGPDAVRGDLMSLGAGISWAATNILIKGSRLTRLGAEKLLLYQLAVSTVVAAALLPFVGPPVRDAGLISTLAMLFQAFYIVAVTYVLWFWLMRRYPASGLASFTFLTPAFGVLFSGLLLGEPLSARLFVALGLIAGGLIVVNRPADRPVHNAGP
jgi:drug/metabolite transporter (DMT)-like permease